MEVTSTERLSPEGSSKHSLMDRSSQSPYFDKSNTSSISKLSVYKQLTAENTEKVVLAAEAGWDMTQNGQLSPASTRDCDDISNNSVSYLT